MRYELVPEESGVHVRASSSLHAVTMDATGLTGYLEAEVGEDGAVAPDPTPRGRLVLAVDRLRSGNPLYDREGARRIDADRFPEIVGELVAMEHLGDGRHRTTGRLTFHGETCDVEGELVVRRPDARTVVLDGEQVFDVRDWGVRPPRVLMLRVHPDARVRVHLVARRR